MSVSNKPLFDWRVYFALSEKIECKETKDSNFAKLEIEDDGKTRWIKGFILKLEGISEDEIESTAEKYGKALADRISVLAGHYVHAHLKGHNQVMNDGTERVVSKHTAKYNIHVSIKLDLQSQEISKAIKERDTSILNERYHYATLG